MNRVRRIYHPEMFQGVNRRRNYFEGWYYKLIDRSMDHVLAIIPGVSLGPKGEGHSFIQILDGSGNHSKYIRYDLSDFKYCTKRFEIEIGPNYFSQRRMELNIQRDGVGLKGELQFHNIIPFPKTLRRPGIMGPYSFVPFMECYHGIVNIHHDIHGILEYGGEKMDFSRGYGYIEKDWGRSFPEEWIWFQSNHFGRDDITIMFSAAKIPWLGRSFTGFISFIRIKKKIYIFATYTKANMEVIEDSDQRLNLVLEDTKYRLNLEVKSGEGSTLKAPKHGLMGRDIMESIDGEVFVQFSAKNGRMIYQGKGVKAGFEYHQSEE